MTDSKDPRDVLRGALDQAGAVIAGVKPDQLSDATPCTEFDVATLMNHLTGAVARVGSVAAGVQVEGGLVVDAEEPAAGWMGAFAAARQGAIDAWADDALLVKEYTLPWATLPGAGIVSMYALETVLHGWDLAVATGQEHLLDDTLAETVFPAARQMLPVDIRGGEMPFEAVVEVPVDASASDRLAGFAGRTKP
jgi:uncharacterized protein (TIGR03086 family)